MSHKCEVIKEKNCIRRIRYSTSVETTAESNDSIVVYARIKPLEDPSQENLFKYNNTNIQYQELDKRGHEKLLNYSFHRVFFPSANQNEIFVETLDNHMDHIISGENRLIFAYGTSSSGKTYTLLGDSDEPGILPRCTVKLFLSVQEMFEVSRLCPDQGADLRVLSSIELEELDNHKMILSEIVKNSGDKLQNELDGLLNEQNINSLVDKLIYDDQIKESNCVDKDASYSVWMSYLEVYNENIYDLLSLDHKPLKIGFDSKKDNYVKGLLHIQVLSWMDMWQLFQFGRSFLHTNETLLNKASSRSHSIVTLKLVKTKNNMSTVSSMSFCDLAGTERQKKAQNVGDSLVESRNINTSLMVLNRCFSAVRENKATNQKKIKPPYRDSKLTMIFQKAFSYEEHITMYVNLSQNPILMEESKHVLKMSAVAQEMVKQIPKKQHRLKPNSRFSVLCSNPNQPFFRNQGVPDHSGVMYLSLNSTHSDETIRLLEERNKVLEETLKRKEEENQGLVEMLEDARNEILNFEKLLEDSEKKYDELEIEKDDLENDFADLEMLSQARANTIKDFQKNQSESSEKIEVLTQTIKILEEELEKRNEPVSTKKVRPLLNAHVHLDQSNTNTLTDSFLNLDAHSTLAEPPTKSKTHHRKCKDKNLF